MNSSKLSTLRDAVRRQARSFIKQADIGGEQDAPFEQAFSNLAHAYLKDKAPSLLDYEVGFQLVERNQENTKAIGVFGFKVGSQWLYAPVFFLNGDLKGHELLYIKNQDMFIPLKENWLNYILNRKPNILGEEVGRNLSDIGVMPPHLSQLSRSPSKYAAALDRMSPWVKEALPTLSYLAITNPGTEKKYAGIVDLPTFLKKEGSQVVKSLIAGFQENPALAQMVDSLHGLHIVEDAIAEHKEREKVANSVLKESAARCKRTAGGVRCFDPKPKPKIQPKSVLPGESTEINTEPDDLLKSAAIGDSMDPAITYALEKKLKVYTYDEVLQHGTGLEGLDGKERSKLLKDKVLIKDERENTSTAYEVESTVRLQNPGETGLYDVLVKSNKFEKCLVIYGPYCQDTRKDFVTIVRVSDGDDDKGRAWLNIHPGNIWTGHQYNREEFQKWWDKLPEAKELSVSRKGLHLLIGNTGEGTLPFTVEKELSDDSRKIYDVHFKTHAEKGRPAHLPPVYKRPHHERYIEEYFGAGTRIQFTGKRGAKLRATGEDLYVPTDYRRLTLKPVSDDSDGIFGLCGCDAHSDPSPIQPGNQFDIDILLGTKTAAYKIYDTGTEIEINGNRMQKIAALIHLVRDLGLREKQARILLKRAAENQGARFRIKKAEQTYPLQQSGASAPGIPDMPTGYDPMSGGHVPTQQPAEWNMKIPELSAANTDRSIYNPLGPEPDYQNGPAAPDRNAQQAAMQAGQSGQKEVFDTAMIGSLLKAVRDDSMVDRYMGDLMKGLDRLGRILFLFYWHGEKFQERYGKSDMVELEDGIRNAFEYLGDLVLFLKQRAVDTGDDNMKVDLGSISG